MLHNAASCAHQVVNRRVKVIALASVLTTLCLFLAWNYYGRELFQPYPQGEAAPILDFGSGNAPIEESKAPEGEDVTSAGKAQPTISSSDAIYVPDTSLREGDVALLQAAPRYIHAILDSSDNSFPRLFCPAPAGGRYDYLRSTVPDVTMHRPKAPENLKYFFALNLHQCVDLLPRLLGSVVETIQFLGPQNCALSIVEGRSDDGTFEVLSTLGKDMERMGIKYFFNSSDINPEDGDGDHRISSLAELRNQALQPLIQNPELYTLDSTTLFINDVSLCMEDMLELIHQRIYQKADMTCGMDWIFNGTSFYDVWISRSMTGDQFFEIPQSGSWEFAENLFWDDPSTRALQNAKLPYQVFACWNGVTAFTAKPLLRGMIRFRSHYQDECFMGEPTYFCKDLWHLGYGKIAVVPSVNVGYDDNQSKQVKNRHGYVSDSIHSEETGVDSTLIGWKSKPPELIKCVPSYERPSWVPSDEALEQHDNLTAFN